MKVSSERQQSLHDALRAGNPTASAEAFELLLDPLIGLLRTKWPEPADAELVRDIAIDSISNYVERPSRFDPARGMSLLSYLKMDADGDLINAHEHRSTAARRMKLVETRESARNGQVDDYPSDREPTDLTLPQIKAAFPDPRDRQAILLLIAGETTTVAYAEVWGITGTNDEKAKGVKRNKDRVKARIKRLRK